MYYNVMYWYGTGRLTDQTADIFKAVSTDMDIDEGLGISAGILTFYGLHSYLADLLTYAPTC